jgi:hypothetical protein
MEENKEQEQPLKTNLFPALIESKLSLDMTKAHGNYRQTLANILTYEVTDDNFEEAQQLLKKVITFLAYVDDHRTAEKKPYLEAGRVVDAAHKTFGGPFEEAKRVLQEKVNAIGRKREEEAEKARKEQDRITGLVNSINSYILESSVAIAAATTNEQLLSIERLINLEKGNKSRYQDHLPLLIERCNELTGKIKEQKDLIRERERVEIEKNKALETGDDKKAEELLAKSQLLDAKMEENTILVQEAASKSVIATEIVAPEINMPNTRRKSWKFEIVDIKEVMKKAPQLLDCELNFKQTSEVLKTLKDTGVLTGKKEYTLNGIRYFEEKNY